MCQGTNADIASAITADEVVTLPLTAETAPELTDGKLKDCSQASFCS